MTLQSLSNSILLSQFTTVVQHERRISREVLQYIAEIDRRRLYADEGFSSTHDWLVSRHGYSHAAAGRRVSAAKLLHSVPGIATKVETGELCMTTLSRVQSAIRFEEKRTGDTMTAERKLEVIEVVETKPKTQIEQSLADIFQIAAPKKSIVQPKSQGEMRMHVTLTAEQMKKFNRAAELLAHKIDDGCVDNLARTIEAMAEIVIAQKDPLVRVIKPRAKKQDDLAEENDAGSSRCGVSLPPSIRNFICRRDSGRCQFQSSNGEKCQSRTFTQIDHIVPRALGGSNEPNNLRVLCRTHNLLMAERIFGSEKIALHQRSKANH